MPCCIIALLAVFGPRFLLVGIWLFNNPYLARATDSFLLQCLGFLFLPWTLLAYAFSINTFPAGQYMGLDTVGLVVTLLGLLLDILSYGGSGYGNRNRFRS
ncbi:MAG: hypothetical protein HY741_06115 [Chloroflexi bacterium]|nr:hypothetical protein [Chloroflexota bacterium]